MLLSPKLGDEVVSDIENCAPNRQGTNQQNKMCLRDRKLSVVAHFRFPFSEGSVPSMRLL